MPSKTLDEPRFAAALSVEADTRRAIAEVCDRASAQLEGQPSLAVVFASAHHGSDFSAVSREIQARTQCGCLLGASGEAIVGQGQEIEGRPALSLWLARLPGVRLWPMRLAFEQTQEGGMIAGWPDDLPPRWPAESTLLLLGEPYSFPADWLLNRLAEDQPGVPVLGGMASGGRGPGTSWVMLGDRAYNEGAVGVLISGDIRVRSVVSQGCRPIGRPMVITRADRQVIYELGGKPALGQFEELFASLAPAEQQLVRQGLHVGRVINEYQDHFARGDFLIRNCIGGDPETGALAIADFVRAGQTVQFHVRDAQTADEDLRHLLVSAEERDRHALGALLFTCNGRGTRMFDVPHHDAAAIEQVLGPIPLAGFFAQGELGPVGGRNFVHGFTASVAIFTQQMKEGGE